MIGFDNTLAREVDAYMADNTCECDCPACQDGDHCQIIGECERDYGVWDYDGGGEE